MNTIPISVDELITVSVVMDEHESAGSDELGQILIDSCDIVRVFLLQNNVQRAWMKAEQVQVYSDAKGGAAAAFIDSKFITGYHLVMSPRYRYPTDFVVRMVQRVERHRRHAILGLGGGWHMYPDSWRYLPASEMVSRDLPVHELDSSILAYHVEHRSIDRTLFGPGGDQLDRTIALWAQAEQLPLIMVQRPDHWVNTISNPRLNVALDSQYEITKQSEPTGWCLFAV